MTGEHLFNFGMSQEDERTEAGALALGASSRVLSVCSAGEMPLNLLALGAGSVDAVDIDDGQLHLAWLKRAAVLALERVEALRFLGYLPAPAGERRTALERASGELPAATREFWRARRTAVEQGAIWAGRYERYVRRLVRWLRLPLGRALERLLGCRSIDEQRRCFDETFDRFWLRATFRLAFHPRVYAHRGMDPRSLAHRRSSLSLGEQFFARFRSLCTGTPIEENYLLQLHLAGQISGADAAPAYLTAQGYRTVRERADHLTLRQKDLHAALRGAPVGAYNAFHLSNLADWMPAEGFAETMRLVAERSDRPGRAVWRFIHIDRPVPGGLEIAVDRDLGARLEARDRFPFYGVVPAVIGATR